MRPDFMTNVVNVSASVQDKNFMHEPLNRQARIDFKEMCPAFKTGYMAIDNMQFQRVKILKLDGEVEVGNFLPIGYEVKSGKVSFPAFLLDSAEKDKYVAVISYVDGKLVEGYIFKASNFKKTEAVEKPLPVYSKVMWWHKFKRTCRRMGAWVCAIPARFSMFQYDKETQRFIIKMPSGMKLKQYSFGHALKSIQK